jgi:UDP-N-acetylmuramate-alanine ligase
VFLSEIDAIRENKIEGISSKKLALAIGENAKSGTDEEILSEIKSTDGAIIIMGAANLENLKTKIIELKY